MHVEWYVRDFFFLLIVNDLIIISHANYLSVFQWQEHWTVRMLMFAKAPVQYQGIFPVLSECMGNMLDTFQVRLPMTNMSVIIACVLWNASCAIDYVLAAIISIHFVETLSTFAGKHFEDTESYGSTTWREIHSCPSLCSANGICEIDTAPQSIEATFTGRHETFQYTKVNQLFLLLALDVAELFNFQSILKVCLNC